MTKSIPVSAPLPLCLPDSHATMGASAFVVTCVSDPVPPAPDSRGEEAGSAQRALQGALATAAADEKAALAAGKAVDGAARAAPDEGAALAQKAAEDAPVAPGEKEGPQEAQARGAFPSSHTIEVNSNHCSLDLSYVGDALVWWLE
jgi:hypothetical protein